MPDFSSVLIPLSLCFPFLAKRFPVDCFTVLYKDCMWAVNLPLSLCCCRLPGNCRGVPLSGDRRAGPAAAEGGPPNGNHEHQTGACTQDLCSDQHAQRLIVHLIQYIHSSQWQLSYYCTNRTCSGFPMLNSSRLNSGPKTIFIDGYFVPVSWPNGRQLQRLHWKLHCALWLGGLLC